MSLKQRTPYTIWVCVDCYFAANGFSEHERGEPYPEGVLSLISPDDEVTSGMGSEDHDTPCGSFDAPGGDFLGGECECETRDFSWTPCGGCGSTLGGSRHALTVWVDESRQRCSSCGAAGPPDTQPDQRWLCEKCL